MLKFAEIIVSNAHKNIDRIFHYIVPEMLKEKIEIGMRVTVPFGFGNKKIEGYVIGFSDETDISLDKMKEIYSVSDEYPVFSEKMILLAKWMKEKYYTTLSDCLQCIMPAGMGIRALQVRYLYLNKESVDFEKKLENALQKNDKKSEVLKKLIEKDGLIFNEVKAELKISNSPILTLAKHEIIKIVSYEIYREPFESSTFEQEDNLCLNDEQQQAFETIKKSFNSNEKKPFLLHGVTGSGKTEVYLQTIEQMMKTGKQSIVLVPEIALTSQMVSRFVSRFGEKVAVTHSRLSAGERFDQWKKARQGSVSIMIGPRSAIFTPFDNLGMIIIDEEHEHTYKSESTPKYDAREVAEKLMEFQNCIVILGTATPAVQTYYRAKKGEIELINLTQRVNKKMPNMHLVDMRLELAQGNRSIFSVDLHNAIEQNLKDKNQTILFMNRRGHSTFVSCRACGNVLSCDKCNVNYTYHRYSNKLMCHYCGKEEKVPQNCPICGSKHIKYFGTGTQKIEEEVRQFFPTARVLRMDMDTTSKKNSHERILTQFSRQEADILVGTQMIAKGHDFPKVSLVGIIAADLALNTGDFRSAETAYQLVMQVSGRAGRADTVGNAYIQTYNPEHYSIVYATENDYEKFYEHEISIREQMQYPPYTNIFSILFTSTDERKIIISLNRLVDIMKFYNRKNQFEMLGPSPAQISKINENYRWRVFVKCQDEEKIKSFVFFCLDKLASREDLSSITVNASLNPNTLF